MQTVMNAGVALNVLDEGPRDGRVLMFSNSLGTDMRVWDFLLPHLPEGLRIVRYDKRGHGLSDCPPAPYEMATLVSDAECVAEALGLSEVTFVGLSIGGLIGQGLAAKRPDLLKALVLMDTSAKIGTAEIWSERLAALDSVGLEGMADAIMERWFCAPFRNSDAVHIWRNMVTRTPKDGYGGCSAAIMGADMRESTAKLTLPVLAVVGDQDNATPPETLKATAALCGAAFELIPDAGHLPCVEQPEATAALLNAFLERTAG